MAKDASKMEKIVSLCKRRGFIFQSSEIYGGIGGFWDYGPLGVELKRNIKDAWWRDMVTCPPTGPDGKDLQMVGLDASLIMNPKVWEASGHVGGFQDPMVSCRAEGCKGLFRADQIFHVLLRRGEGDDPFGHCSVEANSVGDVADAVKPKADKLSKKHGGGDYVFEAVDFVSAAGENLSTLKCPRCDEVGSLTEPRQFNLMFQTYVGATATEDDIAYLRPETAQGIFANFKNVVDSSRVKVPFGIAQVGKAFRNEINPRNYTFRSREFEQMEIEFFCHDDEAMKWWEWWRDTRINWYVGLGLKGENLRPRNQEGDELAHYSKACTDIEYCFPFADEPQELEGVAHRGCYDLTQHQKHSGKDLSYFDDERKERFLPTVIEPSAGADRSTLAFICEAYTVDESRPSPELMKFHPRLAPVKAAVFPLVKKDGMPEIAEPIYRELKKQWPVAFDVKQSIGKRYARMDEAGTPYCFTVDGQTKEDGTVTVRDRDTGSQERIDKSRVVEFLSDKLSFAM
ncbi:MAG: glycine--tRNA ligase [Phycisphaerales bacterium]|nr:glycine--tRNA ligase [Phycisphaerales bacterium]